MKFFYWCKVTLIITFCTIIIYANLLTQPKTITILHTNDIHASFIPHEAYWLKENPKPLIGGFNELSFVVDSIRNVKSTVLLFDGGDVMTGNPITEYKYKDAEGGLLFEMMNLIGYEAWTPGNHDFDISVENLFKLTKITKFPTVSANIVDTNGIFPINNNEFIIIEKGKLKIGVIGIMSADFYNLVNQNSSAGIKILPPIETARKLITQLRPQTDLLIALCHQGYEEDSILAINVEGLDVIIGAHSHTRIKSPKRINNVIIVQAGSNCEYLGVLELTIENKKIINYSGQLIPLWYNPNRPKTALTTLIDSIKTKIDQDYAEVIGTLKTDWKRTRGESGIGNFITDAQRESANADIAFMNSSGIRKDQPAGPITKRDLFEILPFRNVLVKFELTGEEIQSIIKYIILENPGILVSGIQCEWTRNKDGNIEFKKFTINGNPFDINKKYTVSASDYLMGASKKYLGIESPKLTYLNQTVFSAVEKKIREMKEITSVIENRINKVQ